MNLQFLQLRSLKTRVTIFTLIIFVVSIWSLAFYASRMLREDMQRLLGEQQFATVSIVAADINQELDDRLKALEAVAGGVRPTLLGNPAALQTLLEEHEALLQMFNGGTFVTGIDGTAIASIPVSVGRIGVNYLDRDFIIAALKEGKPAIGKPVMGKLLKSPVFVMASPIRDAQGKVIGALMGVSDLGQPGFLDKITGNTYGKTGGYVLIERQSRLVVTATDRSRIMESLPAAGVHAVVDRFAQGYEGSAVSPNPKGVEVLVSGKGIPLAGWYLLASLPTEEAFAPISDMRQRMIGAALILTLLAGGLIWWMLRRKLAPMLAASKLLATLSATNQPPQPLPVTTQDEIGDLIGGFNRLLETLGQREIALRMGEERHRTILQTAMDGFWLVDMQGRLLEVNEAYCWMSGYSAQELLAMRIPDLEAAETANGTAAHIQQIMAKGEDRFESRHQRKDGSVFDVAVSVQYRPADGGRFVVFLQDITERKELEEQLRHLAFYDPLTELPNRRLLIDRLGQSLTESKRSGCYGALMFLDLDNFKALNDTLGHATGDLLLQQAARRTKACVREVDTVARLGGDEFVVLLGDLDTDKAESTQQAGSIAEKIRTALAEPYTLTIKHAGQTDAVVEHRCTASIGVVVFIDNEGSQDDFMKWADSAMYRAKDEGCNLIRLHGADPSQQPSKPA